MTTTNCETRRFVPAVPKCKPGTTAWNEHLGLVDVVDVLGQDAQLRRVLWRSDLPDAKNEHLLTLHIHKLEELRPDVDMGFVPRPQAVVLPFCRNIARHISGPCLDPLPDRV